MRNLLLLCLFTVVFVFASHAQKSGYINRIATSPAGRAILDPNGDGYTSATTAGFGSSDITGSELSFVAIPSFSIEPFGDLRRGPDHKYSDFVPDNGDDGAYLNYSGTNLLFRLRMGSIMSGSKGYSIMLDTDEKFGATGANADPNYQPATSGTNGNPGFEIEVVLETNFRIAIYNVDGTSTPTLIKSYSNWQDMSQVSIAATFDNGDPDFLIDFYIPFSDLQAAPFNLSASSNLRFCATTVMSPQAAIGGPKSDIYGLADNLYKNSNKEYEAYIPAQPTVKLSTLSGGFGPMCTAAPTVNSPIAPGTVTVSGTWTKSDLTGAAALATITVFKNGVSVGTVNNISSGSIWSLPNVSVANGDQITAKAQASGESMCLVSNGVTASSCTPATRPAMPVLTCANNYNKGISGNNVSTGWTVYVENQTRGTTETSVANPSQFVLSGSSPNITWDYAGGCNGGPNMPSGSYRVYYVNASGCMSEPVLFCIATGSGSANNLAGTSATPVITSPVALTPGTSSIAGTGEPNSTVRLYVDGAVTQTVTASATGVFAFTNLALVNNQQVYITNVLNTGTVNTSKCYASTAVLTVKCYTSPPIINADNSGETAAGAPITGVSSEVAGTTIKVYTSANVLVATTAVQANGTWSTAAAGTTPSAYNAVAATSYYAVAQNGSCSSSNNSGSVNALTATSTGRCGSITGPVTAGATSVSGNLTGTLAATTVNLYQDGILAGSTTTSSTAWSVTLASSVLYPGGVLTIGIRESGKQEVICGATEIVGCSTPPVAPVINPSTFSIAPNQTVTYNITNAVAGYFYGVSDATTGQSLATGSWCTSGGNLSITTNSFNSGSYNVVVKATSLSGLSVCTSGPAASSVIVATILPSRFLSLSAAKSGQGHEVRWTVADEQNLAFYVVERSMDCQHFEAVEQVAFAGTGGTLRSYYFFDAQQGIGSVCYRIREVDADGRSYYSNIVSLRAVSSTSFSLSPNPAVNKTSVFIQSPSVEAASLELYDLHGRRIREQKLGLQKGANALIVDGLDKLSPGTYIVRIVSSFGIWNQKLIKE